VKTEVLKISRRADVAAAAGAAALREGKLIGFPTETVYGIAALAEHAGAMRRLREVKDRPHMPFSMHLGRREDAGLYVASPPAAARRIMARAAWPGPVALLLGTGGTVADAGLQRAGLHEVLCHNNTIGRAPRLFDNGRRDFRLRIPKGLPEGMPSALKATARWRWPASDERRDRSGNGAIPRPLVYTRGSFARGIAGGSVQARVPWFAERPARPEGQAGGSQPRSTRDVVGPKRAKPRHPPKECLRHFRHGKMEGRVPWFAERPASPEGQAGIPREGKWEKAGKGGTARGQVRAGGE
jgi:hypothetical protein